MPVRFLINDMELADWSGAFKEIWEDESKEYELTIINDTPYYISNITPESDPRYHTITGDAGVIAPGESSTIMLTAHGKTMYEDRKSAIPISFKYTSSVTRNVGSMGSVGK